MRLFYAIPVTMEPAPKAFRNRNYVEPRARRIQEAANAEPADGAP
jgi:hypothetical protein